MRTVSSWRDSLSDKAQADVHDLLDVVLPFAEQILEERGELRPVRGDAHCARCHRGGVEPSSLRDLRIAEVAELDLQIEGGVVKAYRAKLVKVSVQIRRLTAESIGALGDRRDSWRSEVRSLETESRRGSS